MKKYILFNQFFEVKIKYSHFLSIPYPRLEHFFVFFFCFLFPLASSFVPIKIMHIFIALDIIRMDI